MGSTGRLGGKGRCAMLGLLPVWRRPWHGGVAQWRKTEHVGRHDSCLHGKVEGGISHGGRQKFLKEEQGREAIGFTVGNGKQGRRWSS
jgi:hypothetical protein